MLILGIESSCDETSVSIVEDGQKILSNLVASQAKLHEKYGGVVPELACRAHMEVILPLFEEALSGAKVKLADIDAFAVVNTPGLVGALLVGVTCAKAAAFCQNKPIIAVNHLYAHAYANRLSHPELEFPLVVLIASGGHTSLFLWKDILEFRLLGATTDDAAGEAFDKVAAILNLGYPGGPAVEKVAVSGNRRAVDFPRTLLGKDSLDFSFSGIKTAVLYHVQGKNTKKGKISVELCEKEIADVAASFQEAVADVLVEKLRRAVKKTGVERAAIGGGVSANKRLTEKITQWAEGEGVKFYSTPERTLCLDNGAIVAGFAYHKLKAGLTERLDFEASARAQFDR